ncbi:MAG: SIS domain-containing protein [Thermoplasmatales archaeon]|nr:SIS domain-containing protein [Thermoplasmatales archaeon]
MRTNSLDFLVGEISKSIASVTEEDQNGFVDLLLGKRKIFIYGSGRSGLVGQFFAVRLVQLGLDVHFVGDMTTPIIGKEDLTVLVSNTGETVSTVQTANIARRMGSHVVCVTSKKHSKLAHASNTVIHIPVNGGPEAAEYAPLGTLFEDTVVLFFDSVVPCIMKKLGKTEADMRKRHAIWV